MRTAKVEGVMKKWLVLAVVLVVAILLGASLLVFFNNKGNSAASSRFILHLLDRQNLPS